MQAYHTGLWCELSIQIHRFLGATEYVEVDFAMTVVLGMLVSAWSIRSTMRVTYLSGEALDFSLWL